jgi:hypothetical protein
LHISRLVAHHDGLVTFAPQPAQRPEQVFGVWFHPVHALAAKKNMARQLAAPQNQLDGLSAVAGDDCNAESGGAQRSKRPGSPLIDSSARSAAKLKLLNYAGCSSPEFQRSPAILPCQQTLNPLNKLENQPGRVNLDSVVSRQESHPFPHGVKIVAAPQRKRPVEIEYYGSELPEIPCPVPTSASAGA